MTEDALREEVVTVFPTGESVADDDDGVLWVCGIRLRASAVGPAGSV